MIGRDYRVVGPVENGDRIMRSTFWIGVYPGLTAAHIGYMLQVIHDFAHAKAAGRPVAASV